VTVAWSILSGTGKNMLIKYGASRVTLHHNLFIGNGSRNPQARVDDQGGVAADVTLDMRNNVVWAWTGYGTLVWEGAWANVVNNYYGASRNAVQVVSARAFVRGNETAQGGDINRPGTEAAPFPAPAAALDTPCLGAQQALQEAGVRPLDEVDAFWVASVSLAACPDPGPVPGPGPLPAPVPGPLLALQVAPAAVQWVTVAGALPTGHQVSLTTAATGWSAAAVTDAVGGWLTVGPASGSGSSVLTISAAPGALAPGRYTGRILIAAPGVAGGPTAVPVTLDVRPAPDGVVTVEVPLGGGPDDAREDEQGHVRVDAQLDHAGAGVLLGFRFTGLPVPPGATILSATLWTFAVLEDGRHVRFRYTGEAVADALPFTRDRHGLSSRARTQAFVDDEPGPWTLDTYNPSPDLAAIVQEIVGQPGWAAGNSLALFMADHGSRYRRRLLTGDHPKWPGHGAVLTIRYAPR
jgi:hypothetical protein